MQYDFLDKQIIHSFIFGNDQKYPYIVNVKYGEFTWHAFLLFLHVLGIKDIPTTSKNPQLNAFCKHIHQTMTTMLKMLFWLWLSQAIQDVL